MIQRTGVRTAITVLALLMLIGNSAYAWGWDRNGSVAFSGAVVNRDWNGNYGGGYYNRYGPDAYGDQNMPSADNRFYNPSSYYAPADPSSTVTATFSPCRTKTMCEF